jgi:Ca2+ transporting ATPase
VVRSAHRGPVTSEYNVSGSTYAPDGIILDGAGLKVNILKSYFCCT